MFKVQLAMMDRKAYKAQLALQVAKVIVDLMARLASQVVRAYKDQLVMMVVLASQVAKVTVVLMVA